MASALTAQIAPNPIMDQLLANGLVYTMPSLGSLVECEVIDIVGNKILVDINSIAVGLISGKEAHDSIGTLDSLKAGEKIFAYVIEDENDEGYFVLSLRKASQERTWRTFMKAYETGEIIDVVIHEANKGGLLVMVDGIKGFIPVSQLAPLHYPRVDGANAGEILARLQSLVGQKLSVKIINVDQAGGKLIMSEKAALDEQRSQSLKHLKVGDVVHGVVSGIVKFGIFVAFEGLEGLVHISEIEWGHVKDPTVYAKLGNEVDVQIIGIDGEKISLSMKRLLADPWVQAAERYKVGTKVSGTVDRITQFGVFIKLADDISGLVHLSEMAIEQVKDPHTIVKVGQEIEAKIIAIDPDDHRIGLSMKALLMPEGDEAPKPAKKKKSKETTEEEVEA